MAQLVEQLLLRPEVCSLNPVSGKILNIYWAFVYCQLWIEKTQIKKKKPGKAHLKKKFILKDLSSLSNDRFVKTVGDRISETALPLQVGQVELIILVAATSGRLKPVQSWRVGHDPGRD